LVLSMAQPLLHNMHLSVVFNEAYSFKKDQNFLRYSFTDVGFT
jgi:hypothetical protein